MEELMECQKVFESLDKAQGTFFVGLRMISAKCVAESFAVILGDNV